MAQTIALERIISCFVFHFHEDGLIFCFHELRHTHTSLLLEQGVSIDTISRRLGHENSRITREIYLHVTEKLKERDNEQLARISLL